MPNPTPVVDMDVAACWEELAAKEKECPAAYENHCCRGEVGHLVNCPQGIASSKTWAPVKPCPLCGGKNPQPLLPTLRVDCECYRQFGRVQSGKDSFAIVCDHCLDEQTHSNGCICGSQTGWVIVEPHLEVLLDAMAEARYPLRIAKTYGIRNSHFFSFTYTKLEDYWGTTSLEAASRAAVLALRAEQVKG